MRRAGRSLLAAGVAVAALGMIAGAWAIGSSGGGGATDAEVAPSPTGAGEMDVLATATGTLGPHDVRVRVLGPRGGGAGAAVTVVASTSAAVDNIVVRGPGGTPIPPTTGALLIARSRGEIDAPTSTTHTHGSTAGAQLGAALGATGLFAAKISPGAGDVAVDPEGTRLAATYADAARIEVVDLVRGTRPAAITGLGRPTRVWFAPAGDDVWVSDADAGMRVVARHGTPSAVVGGGPGNNVVAFAPDRGMAVVAGDGSPEAVLVSTASHRRLATLDLPAPATSAAFAARPRAIVLTHADGAVSVAPLNRSRRAYRIATGMPGGSGTTAVVTGDGSRAAVLLPDARRIAVLDLTRHRVLTSIATGTAPRGLELLHGRFAVTRSTVDPSATWVDVRTPSRAADMPLGEYPATAMALTDRGERLLFADPSARQVLDVHQMMGRPMVMGVLPGAFAPDAVVPFPGGARRTGPREFRRTVVLPDDGDHRITVTSADDSFSTTVRGARSAGTPRATLLGVPASVSPGMPASVEFSLSGPAARPVEVVAVSTGASGTRQATSRATLRGGRWVATIMPPEAGVYSIVVVAAGAPIDWSGGRAVQLRVAPG